MSQRPTFTIELPVSKAVVVLKDWISGFEQEAINAPLQNSLKIKPDSFGNFETKEIDGAVLAEMNHAMLNSWVVSVNEVTENILDALGNLPSEDYTFVINAINEHTKKKEE